MVRGRPEVLKATLEILIENALQHGATELKLWSMPDGETLVLHVQDNGQRYLRQAIVTRCSSLSSPPSGKAGGTGLGLTIAAAMLKSCDGRIDLIDAEGLTTFRLTLPVPAA